MDASSSSNPINFEKEIPTINKELQKGTSLNNYLGRAVATAGFLIKSAQVISEHGTSILSGLATTAFGSMELLQGNLTTGLSLTGIGLNQLWNVLAKVDNKQVIRLLDDVGAAHTLLDSIAKENQYSCTEIKYHLATVQGFIDKNTATLKTIQEISSGGSDEIEVAKKAASDKFEEADKLFNGALAEFVQSDHNLSQSSNEFGESLETLSQLFSKSKNLFETGKSLSADEKEKLILSYLESFVKEGEVINDRTLLAKALLDSGRSHQRDGMALLTQAFSAQNEASVLLGTALEASKQHLMRIKDLSTQTTSVDHEMKAMKDEVKALQKNNEITEQVLLDASQRLDEAKRNLGETLGYATVCSGIVVGTTITAVTGLPPLITIPFAVKLVHSREPLYNGAMDVYKFCTGSSESEKYKEPIKLTSDLSLQWNAKSTGYWNYYIAKTEHSWTVGQVKLDLGDNNQFTLSYNLNHKENIPIEEIVNLALSLKGLVEEKKLDPKKCLTIIEELEKCEIDRGPKQTQQKGLIPKDYLYLATLKNTCESLLAKEVSVQTNSKEI